MNRAGREIDETRRENVMSVELAIQRELAFRRKISSLQLFSDVDLMPLHVPSSSPSPWLGKNSDSNSSLNLVPSSSNLRPSPTPSGNTSSRPGASPISSSSLVQGPLCQVSSSNPGPSPQRTLNPNLSSSLILVSSSSNLAPLSWRPPLVPRQIPSPRPRPRPSPNLVQSPLYKVSSSNPSPTARPLPTPSCIRSPSSCPRPRPSVILRPSQSSIKRKASTSNLQRLPPQQPRSSHSNYIKTDQVGNFFCKVCEVPCSGAVSFKQHLKGQKHKAKLQWLQLSREEDKWKKDRRPLCDLCQIWCSDEDSLKMHLKGQNHQAKVQELEIGKKNGGDRPWCELCQIGCMNEDAFEQHLKGKNHVTRLYATGKNKRAKGEEAALMEIVEWAEQVINQ